MLGVDDQLEEIYNEKTSAVKCDSYFSPPKKKKKTAENQEDDENMDPEKE